MTSPQIIGVGRALPDFCLESSQIDRRLNKDHGWCQSKTGVDKRYHSQSQSQIDLAVKAIGDAIEDANIDVSDVDLIISASGVPYQTLPSTAPKIMAEMGVGDGCAAAFDVNSTCLSFLNGLETACHLMASGKHRCAVVVSSEIASRALPWDRDPATAALFGDGAAAVVLGLDEKQSPLKASLMQSYPSFYQACQIESGGTKIDLNSEPERFFENAVFSMDGSALFKVTKKHFRKFVDELLERAGWEYQDVDVIIPHQASPLGLRHLIKATGFQPEKVVNICSQFGNQIAASIPFALCVAKEDGRLATQTKALFLGTSAGVSFGGIAWEF